MQVPANSSVRFRVGEFEVDLRCREVRHNGATIKLQGNPCQILAELLQRSGEVVTREEIRQKLWPSDTFVDFEHGINTAVNKLRQALEDDAENPRFIETLPRVGYRFIAQVETLETNGTSAGAAVPPLSLQQGQLPARFLQKRRHIATVAGALVALLATAGLALFSSSFSGRHSGEPSRKSWVQITDFSNSATSPALSPDGRMIAFIRGPETFLNRGQIYVKMLPDGQPVQLTHDASSKMAPVFSPDGSRVGYTATDTSAGWNTWVVPVLGGEPEELLPNAAALTWTDPEHVLFSEIKTGNHMGIATATESRAGERDVYLPADLGGMAHRSWLSPDGKWILVSEMDRVGWAPCRVLPFDGSSIGRTAGPTTARCTYAGWSPDGKMMYFSADAGDGFHIWRRPFPDGAPEQLTFGPTEEEGIAVSPDGHSLVTSAGIQESTVWVHNPQGERQISGEGFASLQGLGSGGGGARHVFSPDGKRVYYLVRKPGSRAYKSGELWMTDLDSGRAEPVLPGVSMTGFDIAPDGELVTFTALDQEENLHVWVAPLDRSSPPKQLTSSFNGMSWFGPGQDVYFMVREREGEEDLVYVSGANESAPRKMIPQPGAAISGLSPDGDWWLLGWYKVAARSVHGGPTIRICDSCNVGWGPGGKFLYVWLRPLGEMGGGSTIVIGLPPGEEMPKLPAQGLKSANDVRGLNMVAEIDMKGMTIFAPGPNPSIYAYVRTSVQRNLFRIPLK